MNKRDLIIQKHCPVIMAPKFGELEELKETGKYRFIMAQDGLWIDAFPGWGRFREQVWNSERNLPYGVISRVNHVFGGKIPENIIMEAFAQSVGFKNKNKEWAGWIVWSEDKGYHLLDLCFLESSAVNVQYKRPSLPDGTFLVLDLHSHPMDFDTFSHTDDHDDKGGVRYSGVISFPVPYKEKLISKLNSRLCLEGFFFEDQYFNYELVSPGGE